MINHLLKFLKDRYDEKRPVLLAFSGGPDSLALLHLLIEFQKKHPLKFAIAHVDHGWRKESREEALSIAQMAKKLEIQAHFQTLNPKELKGNLEAACREERLRFFSSLCRDFGYQAVLLAHHADDVAETVLKRAFEGTSLPYLNALKSELSIHGMQVWRPLLPVSKRHIIEWLDQRKLKGFSDSTNQDTKFLRAKLRLQLLPYLSEMFGKEVSSSLCKIAEEAAELKDYLDDRISPYLARMIKGKMGNFLDLSLDCPQTLLELKHLIRCFCSLSSSFALSRESLNRAAECLREKAANKTFEVGKKAAVNLETAVQDNKVMQILHIDRGCLLVPFLSLPPPPTTQLKLQSADPVKFGSWEIQEIPNSLSKEPSNWKDLWCQGKGEVVLPRGNYVLAAPHAEAVKWWAAHKVKVPAFLRSQIPILLENGRLKHEFLTGSYHPSSKLISGDLQKFEIRIL